MMKIISVNLLSDLVAVMYIITKNTRQDHTTRLKSDLPLLNQTQTKTLTFSLLSLLSLSLRVFSSNYPELDSNFLQHD